jgi:hypothetical protein
VPMVTLSGKVAAEMVLEETKGLGIGRL